MISFCIKSRYMKGLYTKQWVRLKPFSLGNLMKSDAELGKHQITDAVIFSIFSNLKSSKHGT
jgi:hypothetical protein